MIRALTMKKITLTFLFFQICNTAFNQVAIGTNSPVASAKLQVDATNKGFLPPRVTLTGTGDASTISSPATGLMVFNTATAGSGATAVTPGIYYYDGAKWQRVINQQPDATVEFSVNADPNTAGTTFSGTATSKDFVYVSTINASQWVYNGTAYVTYTPPASTPWYTAGGTTDAGSNMSGSVYRTGKVGIGGSNTPNATLDIRTNPTSTTDPGAGFLGIGTTSALAGAAGSGAIRYSTSSGGVLQYSSGTAWNTLQSTVQKAVVTGYFSGDYLTHGTYTLTCNETSDASNVFSANTFTAPRTGLYLVTANLLTANKAWTAGEELTIAFTVDGTPQILSAFFYQVASSGAFGGPTISAVVAMNANQTAVFRSITYPGSSGFSVNGNASYNRFSITEL
jgi:hypothetical protein